MNKIILNIILVTLSFTSFSQWTEDFNDNELQNNPLWRGESTKFSVENGILRLNDTTKSGTAKLTTDFRTLEEFSFEIFFRMQFNPSDNNKLIYRLYSHQSDDTYFEVSVGRSSDDIRVYLNVESGRDLIVNGQDDMLDHSSNNGTLRFNRDSAGWKISYDDGVTGKSLDVGVIPDSLGFPVNRFEIECIFTSTRSDKFYFDDIVFTGQSWADISAPVLTDMSLSSDSEIHLKFNEQVITYSEAEEFIVEPLNLPASVVDQPAENEIMVSFDQTLPENQYLQLFLPPVFDTADNFITGLTDEFILISPEPANFGEVIITEIMSDPTPAPGPYGFEYLELYNTSDRVFDLLNWKISDGSRSGSFPSYYLFPGEHVLILSEEHCHLAGLPNNQICLSEWPTLNNSGETVLLSDDRGNPVDSVTYQQGWHDPTRQNGGWSLEKSNYAYKCQGGSVWISSMAEKGGTPGDSNSVVLDISKALSLNSAQYKDPVTIRYVFNNNIYPDVTQIQLLNEGEKVVIDSIFVAGNMLDIRITEPFVKNTPLETKLQNIESCIGDKLYHFNAEIIRTDSLKVGDLVINEVLFDPFPGGVEFIEIYNPGPKYLNLEELIVEYKDEQGFPDTHKFSNNFKIMKPNDIFALTIHADFIHKFYPGTDSTRILEGKIPYLPVKSGYIILRNENLERIDSTYYSRDFHFQLLKSTEGVSLELINYEADPMIPANWHSASATSGYATPGKKNSHFITGSGKGQFACLPEVLIVNQGVIEEPLQIRYGLQEGFWVGTLSIYDINGNLVSVVVNNQTISSEGSIFWQGNVSNYVLLKEGLYLAKLQAYNDKGDVIEKMDVFAVHHRNQ